MTMKMRLKYIDDLGGGRKRFRRRWPKDVAKIRGETFFQQPLKCLSDADLVAEHKILLKKFDATVATHRRTQAERDRVSPRVLWEEAQREADRLLEGAYGGEEVVRRVLAEDLAQRQADPLLYRAVMQPDAPPPAYTLADAFDLYAKERVEGQQGRSQKNRLARVRMRAENALGKPSQLPMADLRREHGRKLLEHLQSSTTSTGKLLSPATIRRELDMVRAIVERALLEFDLVGIVANPFRKLEIKQAGAAPTVSRDSRLPLPDDVIAEVRDRLTTKSKRPELVLIWRLLEGTGCRPSEVSGLRLEDVRLDHDIPHIQIIWHEDRRIKTEASHRLVPLVGGALDAARDAVTLAQGDALLFPHYAREAGSERLSAILNKHVRAVTKDPRHVAYSLRHNFKNRLMTAGADARIENRIMGHATGNLGDRVYGSQDAWLKVAADVVRRALS